MVFYCLKCHRPQHEFNADDEKSELCNKCFWDDAVDDSLVDEYIEERIENEM